MVMTALLFSLYPLMHSALAMGCARCVLGLALGTVQPMIMSMLAPDHAAAPARQALGLRLMAINASSVSMPMLFGADRRGDRHRGVFWVVAGVVAGGTGMAYRLRSTPAHSE
jgi:uncharacterized membrane protein YfcA